MRPSRFSLYRRRMILVLASAVLLVACTTSPLPTATPPPLISTAPAIATQTPPAILPTTPVPTSTLTLPLTPTLTVTLLPGTDPYTVYLGELLGGTLVEAGQIITATGEVDQPLLPNAITLARTSGLGSVGPFWYHNWGYARRDPQGNLGLYIQFSPVTPQNGGYTCTVNGSVWSGNLPVQFGQEDLGSDHIEWDCYAWFDTAGNHTGIGNFYVGLLVPAMAGGGKISAYGWNFVYYKDGRTGAQIPPPTSTPYSNQP